MIRRSKEAPRRYELRPGRCYAIEPKAFSDWFVVPESRDAEEIEGVAVIDVHGPLEQHDDGWCDSYEAIVRRVKLACDSTCRAILLRIDSPGGDVGGCFDAPRTIRAACAKARKPLVAYVEGRACSSGYAIASAASQIILSDTGLVGSIGVLSERSDFSQMNAARGLRVALVSSGSSKMDGHPDHPVSDGELKRSQRIVDSLASKFFALVSEMRPLPAEAVEALDAQIYHGDAAVRAGLADSVESFDAVIARLSRGQTPEIKTMANDFQKARDALQKAAEGDDANAEAAKRALAALGEGDGGESDDAPPADDETATDPPADDDKSAADGTDDDEKAADETDDDKSAADETDDKAAGAPGTGAKASTREIALRALAEAHQLKAEKRSDKVRAERKVLLDSRPDFAADLRAQLEIAPIETVRSMVKSLKRGVVPTKTAKAAGGVVQGTRGHGTKDVPVDQRAPGRHSSQADELDQRMGLAARSTSGVSRVGNSVQFSVLTDAPATPAK